MGNLIFIENVLQGSQRRNSSAYTKKFKKMYKHNIFLYKRLKFKFLRN